MLGTNENGVQVSVEEYMNGPIQAHEAILQARCEHSNEWLYKIELHWTYFFWYCYRVVDSGDVLATFLLLCQNPSCIKPKFPV